MARLPRLECPSFPHLVVQRVVSGVPLIVDQVDQEDDYQAACARQLAILGAGMNLGTQGAATWTRAALHER